MKVELKVEVDKTKTVARGKRKDGRGGSRLPRPIWAKDRANRSRVIVGGQQTAGDQEEHSQQRVRRVQHHDCGWLWQLAPSTRRLRQNRHAR
jgi:hypothetical protein